jgi:multidrug resistance protein, MATE family
MKQTHNYREKIREFVIVLLPIFVTQIAIVSTGFCDTVMSGHVSEQDLAGVAVGVNIFMPFFGSMLGVISGLTPTIAQLYGAGEKNKIAFAVTQGMYWAFFLAVGIILLGFLAVPQFLGYLQLEPKVTRIASYYLLAMSFGLCPAFCASVLRNFIDALGYTRLTMMITICIVPFNIMMNYLFIFGAYGFPALGGIGAGVGTAITFYFLLLLNVLAIFFIRPFSRYKIFAYFSCPVFAEWKRQLFIGIPIGSAMFCEQSIFGAVGVFMTVYGTGVIAAHQAALNFTTMAYMIPLSISMTLTILVGFEVGAKRFTDARKYSRLGIVLSLLFTISLAMILIHLRADIAALYTNDDFVKKLLQLFLVYAICLQVSDGVSAPLQGTLRGYKDVKITFILAVVSYWIIGLPTGYALANYFNYGPYGYWIGLIAGIAAGAVFLGIRLFRVQKRAAFLMEK